MTPAVRQGGAVLGSPVAHSLSPVLHQAAYDELGLDGWSYRAVECAEEQLAATLRDLDAQGLAGVSLTMPLKRAVLPLLETLDDPAQSLAVANTVLFGGDGRWRGANTDVAGISTVLRAAGVQRGDPGVPWVLGAGATARSAIAALAEADYPAVIVVARRPEATAELVELGERLGVMVGPRPWTEIGDAVHAPVVISTMPTGATDELAGRIGPSDGLLVDVVYAPWPTALAVAWQAGSGRVVGGLELLVEQAAGQVRLMTGLEPPVEAMRQAGYAAAGSG